MPHPLVCQLRFTRSEFRRALAGVNDDDGRRRFDPMNCIAWNVGHLAWQEQRYFLFYAQQQRLHPSLDREFAYGAPASQPALTAMWTAWEAITQAVDPWLDGLTTAKLQERVVRDGQLSSYLWGSLLQRVIYHYWYHAGENLAIRQMLGHSALPEFVGDIDGEAPYRPE